MSRNRQLIYWIRRKKKRLSRFLVQVEFTNMIYKGYTVTLVDIPEYEMSDAIAEAKELIDGIDKERYLRSVIFWMITEIF